MNVSTAGIGLANNNFNGSDTSSIGLDESFVANPEFDFTKVNVYIDNSVGGYSPTTEALYYRIYYTDGSTSGAPTKVLAGDLIAGAKSNDPVHFLVQGTGGKVIDAVQLTMDTGTVKIPFMEFVSETANLADDVQLAFLATITDGDGDTASSAFFTNLYANEIAGSFNYVLTGTSGADAFNIDLPDAKNLYQVNSFTVGTDKLVLLGANSYVIDNTGTDSIVDITETAGGQHTFVTVMGVDMVAGDIATIAVNAAGRAATPGPRALPWRRLSRPTLGEVPRGSLPEMAGSFHFWRRRAASGLADDDLADGVLAGVVGHERARDTGPGEGGGGGRVQLDRAAGQRAAAGAARDAAGRAADREAAGHGGVGNAGAGVDVADADHGGSLPVSAALGRAAGHGLEGHGLVRGLHCGGAAQE